MTHVTLTLAPLVHVTHARLAGQGIIVKHVTLILAPLVHVTHARLAGEGLTVTHVRQVGLGLTVTHVLQTLALLETAMCVMWGSVEQLAVIAPQIKPIRPLTAQAI